MQETLQTRLTREAIEKYSRAIAKNAMGYEELEDIVSHTIAKTIKAGVELIEGEKINDFGFIDVQLNGITHKVKAESDRHIFYNQALQTAVTKLQELLPTNDRSV